MLNLPDERITNRQEDPNWLAYWSRATKGQRERQELDTYAELATAEKFNNIHEYFYLQVEDLVHM